MSTALSTRESRQLMPFFRPFEMLRQEFDDMFGRWAPGWDGNWMTGEFKAACDVSETADAFQLRMDVPGIKPDDIKIEVTGNTVHVSGERKEEKEEKGKMYHRLERHTGSFSEMVTLPGAVKDENVQAEFHNGVLTVTLPKTEVCKTRTVKVNANVK